LKEFEKLIALTPTLSQGEREEITGTEAFKLYDTYGFPLELTRELAEERGLNVDTEGFDRAFQVHKDLSRAGAEQKFKGGLADTSELTTQLHSATHLLLAGLKSVL